MYKDLFAAVFRLLFDENRESAAFLLFLTSFHMYRLQAGMIFAFCEKQKNPNNINRYCLVVLHHNNLITEGNCIQTVRNYYAGNTCIAARILSAVFAYLSSVVR